MKQGILPCGLTLSPVVVHIDTVAFTGIWTISYPDPFTRIPDEIKGSGIIQFLDNLDWSFEKQSKTTGSWKVAQVRWHTETVPKWRTEDSKWTSVNVSLWFNRLSFVRNIILGALFEDFESTVDSLNMQVARRELKGVTLGIARHVTPGFPTDNYLVFRLCSASCCFPFKWNAFFPMSFNPYSSPLLNSSSFCHSDMCSANRIPWFVVSGFGLCQSLWFHRACV